MGSKSKSMKKEEVRLSYDAGILLRQIADGLSQQKFECQNEDETFVIEVPHQVKVKFSAKEKLKKDGTKTKVKIELGWFNPLPAVSESDEAEEVAEESEMQEAQAPSDEQTEEETAAEEQPESEAKPE